MDLNKKIEHVQNLIAELDNLPHRDKGKLDALKRRADMIIRNIFGESSKYLNDLKRINFFPMMYPADEAYYNERWLSGKNEIHNLFVTMKDELMLFAPEIDKNVKKEVKVKLQEISRKIFIVHGHDEEMKQAIARTLEKIDFDPIILHEKPNKGNTLIEKFTDYADVAFAIVLLSPDDVGYERNEKPETATFRSRQNVIFELGYFIGKLGRDRVLALYRKEDNFDMPNDYSGVLYVPYEPSGRWQYDILKELKACGYEIDANKLIED